MPPRARLDDILSIAGNAPVYERLKQQIADRGAIAFIGAGASAPLYPLWTQLIKELAHKPVEYALATPADEQFWIDNAADKPLHMASQIRKQLTDPYYYTFLYDTFKDRTGVDGLLYTPAHAALMRANFKAWITTNYDPGIVHARAAVHTGLRDTGFAIWDHSFEVNRWASGDLFKSSGSLPILYAHGHYADPERIVLDRDSYRRAYHDTPYRRLFENLWYQEHLVLVGFSFRDAILEQIADDVLHQTARQSGGAPRHIAILGLRDDTPYSDQMRRLYLEPYHAEVLFYPVTGSDHSALTLLLESLAARPVEVAPAPSPPKAVRAPARFIHETTEDEKFTGRADALARLDRWAADPAVRIIAISAIGGLGKTALAGRWLRARSAEAVFFWSFYRDREPARFLEAFAKFSEEAGAHRLIVALDGLEVIQEVPGTVAYGKLLEFEVGDFLHAHANSTDAALVLLTSRFPFPDLSPYLGGALRSFELPALEPADGSALLASLGIGGNGDDRTEISRRLEGHPLALRVFARSMPRDTRGDPTRLWGTIFDTPHLSSGDSLESKMQRLLEFYEQRLPQPQRDALGLLALFRAPVDEKTLAPLWEKLLGNPADSLGRVLRDLHNEHLLTADPGYACHPILRDHFRARFLGQSGRASEAAGLLGGPPDSKPRTREELRIVVTAIELLLDVGEVKAAHDLYTSRTHVYGSSLFLTFAAPHWGLEVARAFIRDEARRQSLKQLGFWGLAFHCSEIGVFAHRAGETETALAFLRDGVRAYREHGPQEHLVMTLFNLGSVEISAGALADAAANCAEALELAAPDDKTGKRNALAFAGYAAMLRGDLEHAERAFKEADAIEKRRAGLDLNADLGIQWAEHLICAGDLLRARQLTETNAEICKRNDWHLQIAMCEWIFAWLDTLEGHFPSAHAHLDRAKDTFTSGHMIRDLARTLLTESECLLAEGNHAAAGASCERALQLAAPRSYRLIHSDALNLRARIRLSQSPADPLAASDDAEAALQIARPCEYYWAERDALGLLTRAHHLLNDSAKAQKYAVERDRLKPLRRPSSSEQAGLSA